MNLSIKYNLSEKDWDAFAAQIANDGGFLQSWRWGEFQRGLDRKIFRLAVFDGAKIVALALIIKQEMPLGFSYLYLPRGPVIGEGKDRPAILDFLFLAIKKIARAEQAIFLRLDPPWASSRELAGAGFNFIGSVQPKSTLILDLSKSEEELLAAMKPKTRYNIKVAQKRGIIIKESAASGNDFEDFWRLLQKTSARDRIKSHTKEYYRKMLACPGVRLVFAELDGQKVAANIMARFGAWEIYLHGASDYDFRDKMGPYLLQWRMIAAAKKNNCRFYDFWGADAKKWPGVTRFKRGFAPDLPLTEYIGAHDLVYKKFFYQIYLLIKKF